MFGSSLLVCRRAILFMLFVFVCVLCCPMRLDYMSNMDSILLKAGTAYPILLVGSSVLFTLAFCVLFFFPLFFLLNFFLWIAHSWLLPSIFSNVSLTCVFITWSMCVAFLSIVKSQGVYESRFLSKNYLMYFVEHFDVRKYIKFHLMCEMKKRGNNDVIPLTF